MRPKPLPTPAHPDAAPQVRQGRATARSLAGEEPVLRAAYRLCRRTTRQHDPGIHALIQLAPAVLRPACWALWAAASVLDDLSDDPDVEPDERAARVEAWTRALQHDLASGTSTDPVRHALVDTAGRWRLDLSSLHGAMAVTRDDAHGLRITDWAAWRAWCSGGVVPWVDQVRQLFERAGAPMTLRLDRQADYEDFVAGAQLTDILTDLSVDLAQRRLLLPQEALDSFPGADSDLSQGHWSPAVAALTLELTALARRWVTQPVMTRGMHPGAAIMLEAAAGLMRAQLDAVDAAGPALLKRAPRPSVVARTRVLVPARLRSAMAWSLTPLTVPGPRPTAAATTEAATTEAATTDPGPAADGTGLRPPPPHPHGARPPQIAADQMPSHVAVVMDGNGRWAEQRGLSRSDGHRAGILATRETVYGALDIGLRNLTLYAFSTENWKRDPEEIAVILSALRYELTEGPIRDLNVRQRWAGQPGRLPEDLVQALMHQERRTRARTGMTLTVCINYGGRDEITRTAAALAQATRAGEVNPDLIGPDDFTRHLPHPDMPDVDLLWRTGNEQRTSNFLPWHATYAELYFTPDHWPDTDRRDLWKAITEYTRRQRRHGAVPTPSPPRAAPCPLTRSGSGQSE
ncbi:MULTISPECIES: polyprenyl diphosphate synthase [Streptomyces]|uniref:Isoprenyl transferase n=1 Tax=Streptomyces sviceus (strain ATCC 29083 / DSM 924 / JCM 4929 / NBRC 13980 / NCIMB 11184 / NRRL 5439 / UC 5370) TaxID=463191 RepID=B5I5N9_STRX2|nr:MULTISPECIES: polyprenyl diphosphate synthase [Streptomyces]EDY60394.2 long-chain Z-isoprenyl diphosphate synthase [Streptomyces sviceus ATCC 29083]MYT09423.1 di-trans,poly-cis-decaprenylcistransferase [Streptomyces sp. SID5470]